MEILTPSVHPKHLIVFRLSPRELISYHGDSCLFRCSPRGRVLSMAVRRPSYIYILAGKCTSHRKYERDRFDRTYRKDHLSGCAPLTLSLGVDMCITAHASSYLILAVLPQRLYDARKIPEKA